MTSIPTQPENHVGENIMSTLANYCICRVLAKNPLAKGVVRSQRTVVTPVRDASGSWKMGKKKVVRVRSNSSASSSASS